MSRGLPPHWAPGVVSEIKQKLQTETQTQGRALGRKGLLYLQKTAPSVKPEEKVRITARRMLKAERDERMDVTHALTPVKQYMPGFTRPSDLRSSNWFPGGSYVSRSKVYESPVEDAYLPYTVFILESRYNIRFGIGRVDAPHYVYGVCLEEDLPAVLARYNSSNPPDRSLLEFMDNARWPDGPQQRKETVKWWDSREELQEALEALGSVKASAPTDAAAKPKAGKQAKLAFMALPRPQSTAQPVRAFHSSSARHVGGSYNDDHVVPKFYVRHKQDKGDENEKQLEEDSSSLMPHLSDSILSDDLVASTRRLASKIPTDLFNEDGVLVHPSGFVVPTPSDATERKERERDLAQQTAAVAERVLEEDFSDVSAETSSRRGKVPFEVRGVDGTVTHPSGFEPPTAADEFEHSGNHTVDSHIGEQPLTLGSNPVPGSKRGLHTSAVVRAQEVQWDFQRAKMQQPATKGGPFWRPLLTLTVSTRPIALSLIRLARSGPTGTPFHALLDNDDKKCRISFANRIRSLRLRRMQNLAVEMGQVLNGMRGGVIGLRLSPDTMGRGIGGEGLQDPIPFDKQQIQVGVAKSFGLATELKEMFRQRDSEEISASNGPVFEMFDLDDHGNRFKTGTGEAVPWRAAPETKARRIMQGAVPVAASKPVAASEDAAEEEEELELLEDVADDQSPLPHPFELATSKGKVLYGPKDGQERTLELKPMLARRLVQRRLDSFHLAKEQSLAYVLATRHKQVDLPA
ncbi:hypothetical protein FB45DRAFT_899992 [Roridomyces roridus]|uniref:Uncharacterized protein n=1 Tax=Roridomyces roridus TaxID=1738132 RepID=A0AAD7C7K4_9AGAR|nr:hypothetical protein FB45DRAFT_899992 [Roridomyces roridus]